MPHHSNPTAVIIHHEQVAIRLKELTKYIQWEHASLVAITDLALAISNSSEAQRDRLITFLELLGDINQTISWLVYQLSSLTVPETYLPLLKERTDYFEERPEALQTITALSRQFFWATPETEEGKRRNIFLTTVELARLQCAEEERLQAGPPKVKRSRVPLPSLNHL